MSFIVTCGPELISFAISIKNRRICKDIAFEPMSILLAGMTYLDILNTPRMRDKL